MRHIFAAVSAVVLISAGVARAEPWVLTGWVVNVHDGDSITLLDNLNQRHKIRLDGIDAPELGQAYGRASRASLRELAHRRPVTAECHKTDRYGRSVCLVITKDGSDVALAQLERGLAWFFVRYAKDLPADRRARYKATEAKARSDRVGLWTDALPVAPWDWRVSHALGD